MQEMATEAGSTHPTGMHSCFIMNYYRPQRSCEGYVFTHICHSVHRRGAIPACIADSIPACLAAGGVCSGGGGDLETPPSRRLLLRTVRILLECILVIQNNTIVYREIQFRHLFAFIKLTNLYRFTANYFTSQGKFANVNCILSLIMTVVFLIHIWKISWYVMINTMI